MRFERPLVPARLLRRYKRFLADVECEDGRRYTVHCPNTGAMLGCDEPGSPVWLSVSDNPARKYRHTWELVQARGGAWVGINTARSNQLVEEALSAGRLEALAGYTEWRREVRIEEGRLDFLLRGCEGKPDCYLEVKNVTAAVTGGIALFPDAVSKRASRHLGALISKVRAGHRAALVYCVQRHDVDCVVPADDIDPEYGRILRRAVAAGVELLALKASVDQREIVLREALPVKLPEL